MKIYMLLPLLMLLTGAACVDKPTYKVGDCIYDMTDNQVYQIIQVMKFGIGVRNRSGIAYYAPYAKLASVVNVIPIDCFSEDLRKPIDKKGDKS